MMLARQGFGMIPDWQFSMDPEVNPKINPHVVFPEGWDQRTVQPQGKFYAAPQEANLGGFRGLGRRLFAARRASCCDGCACYGSDPCCDAASKSLSGVFDSWAWEHRKWLVIGGLGLLAAGLLTTAGAVLR